MSTLRLIQRIHGDKHETVRMHEIKSGDSFMLFNDDGTQVGNVWLAIEDATIIDGVAGVNAIEKDE